jgi:hypothetical protein
VQRDRDGKGDPRQAEVPVESCVRHDVHLDGLVYAEKRALPCAVAMIVDRR